MSVVQELVEAWNEYVEAYNASQIHTKKVNSLIVEARDKECLTLGQIGRILSIKPNSVKDRYKSGVIAIYEGKTKNLDKE